MASFCVFMLFTIKPQIFDKLTPEEALLCSCGHLGFELVAEELLAQMDSIN